MNSTETSSREDIVKNKFTLESMLSEEEKIKLYDSSSRVEFIKRDTIIKQNSRASDIAIIQTGLVKISREMRRGKNLILRIAQPGCLIGVSSALANETYNYSAFAVEPTFVRFVNIETFKWLISTNPVFASEMTRQISAENLFNIARLSSLLYKQLPGRVADIILYFSEDIFCKNEFSIPLTRQELAELAGTTKESLIRTLSEFKNDKIIDMNRNVFSINSLNILKTLSRLG
jgi:CRP/FNR family transcriptional regulator, polysaccharide utilization system transcription regulator